MNGTRPRVKNKQGGSDPPATGLRHVKWQVEGRIILVPSKKFFKWTCMFDALIECALCGLRPHDELK
ncbi:MAG TPA: hypothetical protein VNN24_09650 [Candidatus Binatus sp.]|nr:hypothetical protein [Candidatus Binatus sp.]